MNDGFFLGMPEIDIVADLDDHRQRLAWNMVGNF